MCAPGSYGGSANPRGACRTNRRAVGVRSVVSFTRRLSSDNDLVALLQNTGVEDLQIDSHEPMPIGPVDHGPPRQVTAPGRGIDFGRGTALGLVHGPRAHVPQVKLPADQVQLGPRL